MTNNYAKIRDILVKEIEDDIVGPQGGPEEVLPRSETPTATYLSGILFPKQTPIDPEDDEKMGTEERGDENSADEATNPNSGLRPSSLGLTCTVKGSVPEIVVQIDYGKYFIETSEDETEKSSGYKRTHHFKVFNIKLTEKPNPFHLDEDKTVLVNYNIRKSGNDYIFSIFLINDRDSKVQEKARTEQCIFQPIIKLKSINDNEFIFIDNKSSFETVDPNDDESMLYALLFRSKKNFAMGHSCSVKWDVNNIKDNAVSWIESTFIPTYEVPVIEPSEIEFDCLYMDKLFKVSNFSQYKELLNPIADAYENWIVNSLENKINSISPEFRKTALNQINECRLSLNRIRKGIQIVSENENAGKAFSFANRAMYLQLSYGLWARSNQEKGKVEGYEPPQYKGKWRLFQIAFILLNIESITNPTSDARKYADLLWFPTGGGKTEAYLGLIAFTLAHRRLRHSGDDDYLRYGVSVIMRYTLRLLTLQQFHRAAALMCACEFIRRHDLIPNTSESKWGSEPFLVGLWVGANTTPNTLDGENGAQEAITKARTTGIRLREHNPIQIISCPWCGSKLREYNYDVGGKIRQCRITCSNKYCMFSSKKDDEGLPILVVDEDIYRRCPSLIIGTIDKFAQISWKWETGAIFGRVNKWCEKHGFVMAELNKECGNHKNAQSFNFHKQPFLYPPELIIQDELHLISGPLGTLTGLYETAIDILCTHNGIPPKTIASTATTRRASDQIRGVFNRDVSKIFPPQGFYFGDSYFAREVPLEKKRGRMYMGICATSKSGLTILGRLSAAVIRKVRSLNEKRSELGLNYSDLDPFFTLVSYFNSIRELGGASKMYDDSVPDFIQRIYTNFEDKENQALNRERGELQKRRFVNAALEKEELTSRIDSGEIPEILKKIEIGLKEGVSPVDLLLCTNMLSVGVDIARLGIMIINGQPKNHSEYIQASGRIGRTSPGLIVTSYNYLKPRDLSHYENFVYYHSTFHKNVEAVSVTPFASRARDRALFGVIVALVRLLEVRLSENIDAQRFDRNVKYIGDLLVRIREQIRNRVDSIDKAELEGTLADFDALVKKWHEFAHTKTPLIYKKNPHEKAKKNENIYHLLKSTEEIAEKDAIPIPNSLRDAEPEANLWYLSDESLTEAET